jgi:hypothetical protein
MLCGFESSQYFDLLYRGSLYGFKASDFHKKCDNIPKTLTIIKSTNGNIFGGYTEATWEQNERFKSDKSAFIFSLVNCEKKPVKMNIANGQEGNAIFCSSRYGPVFGRGFSGKYFDMCIFYDSNSLSNFGGTYVHHDYTFDFQKAFSFLAGSFKFQVEEIEVFQLK